MKLAKCTCIYRDATLAERDDNPGKVFVLSVEDPWCPASETHDRVRKAVAA